MHGSTSVALTWSQRATGGGRVAPGAATESRVWKRAACPWGTTAEVERLRTNIGHIRVDSREGIGRVESGTETEKMSGANFPDKVEEVGQSRKPEPRSNYRTLQRTTGKIRGLNEIARQQTSKTGALFSFVTGLERMGI